MFIKLTQKIQQPTEEALKRLEALREQAMEDSTTGGPGAQWYRDQGLTPPEWLELENNLSHPLDMEKDIEEVTSEYLCNTSLVEDFEDDKGSTMITYDSGSVVFVKESLEEIFKMIKKL